MWPSRITLEEEGELVTVLVDQHPYMRYPLGDALAQRLAIVQLHALGLASQDELAKAFHVHSNSVYNALSAFRREGSQGLCPQPRGPQGAWKVDAPQRGKILAVAFAHGIVNADEIAQRLREEWPDEVSASSIREVLRENGVHPTILEAPARLSAPSLWDSPGGQLSLPLGGDPSSKAERAPSRPDRPPVAAPGPSRPLASYSQTDRLYLAQLRETRFNPLAGGLAYVPFLARAQYLATVPLAVDEGEEDYTREQMALTLFYLNAFRVRSVEAFKLLDLADFGLLIGKLTSPTLWTVRRFLKTVARTSRTEALVDAVTTTWLQQQFVTPTPLYVDGHFMPYYGEKVIAKGYWPQRQMGLKGSELFMAVDDHFRPVVWSLTSCQTDLTEAIPALLTKLKTLSQTTGVSVKDLTIIFDREGYSGPLFRALDALHVTFITWAKYADRWVDDLPAEQFTATMTLTHDVHPSEEIRYVETTHRMSKYGAIRAIVIESGHHKKRAAIFTNARRRVEADPPADPQAFLPAFLSAADVIQLIGRRWGEENWFHVMKHSLRLDYVPGHDADILAEQPQVDNPARTALARTKAALTERLRSLQVELGQHVAQATTPNQWAALPAASLPLRAAITEVETSLRQVADTQTALPATVSFAEAHGEPLEELEYHRKRFFDTTKMYVYLLEKQLCDVLAPGYAGRKRDLWPTLHTIVRRGGEVRLEGETLTVQLRRFWNPAVHEAAQTLCARLNEMAPRTLDKFAFNLRYEVE